MARREELTDEQWAIIAPPIPEPPRREDGRGRPWKDSREVMNGALWVLGAALVEKICPNGFRLIKPAIAGSSSGSAKAFYVACWKPSPKTFEREALFMRKLLLTNRPVAKRNRNTLRAVSGSSITARSGRAERPM